MFQSRDEIRQIYLTVWNKLQARSLLEPMESVIAEVIEQHPEYHDHLNDSDDVKERDFTPEAGQTNPFLHMGMHIALREQASTDRPSGINAVYQQLVSSRGQHQAEHAMMECLGEALWNSQRNNQPPDESLYLECLRKL